LSYERRCSPLPRGPDSHRRGPAAHRFDGTMFVPLRGRSGLKCRRTRWSASLPNVPRPPISAEPAPAYGYGWPLGRERTRNIPHRKEEPWLRPWAMS